MKHEKGTCHTCDSNEPQDGCMIIFAYIVISIFFWLMSKAFDVVCAGF